MSSARKIVFFLYYSRNHLKMFGAKQLPQSVESQAFGSMGLEAQGLACVSHMGGRHALTCPRHGQRSAP